jgi:hypothetical protein
VNRIIYTPDGEPIQVEWYVSDGKAAGVEAIRTTWIARPVGPQRELGFGAWKGPDPKPVRKPKPKR